MPPIHAASALSNLVVLDLTRARAGPTAARQFADWGADVIKIEAPGDKGEEMGKRHGADFQNLHRNKRAMTLDLKQPAGREIFLHMARKADIVLENYRPDVKFRLGVDYESLRAVNPRIIYGSISGFGQDGPYASRGGLDQIAQGMGGHMSITGEPGRGPMRSGAAISDMFSGLICANAVLTALHERDRTGEGQWVSTSLLEAQIFMLDFQAARWLVAQDVATQEGNNHPSYSPMGVFRARDGYLNLAPLTHMWRKVCEVLGDHAIATSPDFATLPLRRQNRAALNAAIDAVVGRHDRAHWVEAFNAAGIPCGPIYAVNETFADPQVRHLGIAKQVNSPVLGNVELVGQASHMSAGDHAIATPTPEHGQHTHEVLEEFGYSDSEIEGFRMQGVV